MRRHTAVVFIVTLGVLLGSVLGLARQGGALSDQKIAALIQSLDTRYWDKAVDDLVAVGAPAVAPLLAVLRRGGGQVAARACLPLARIGTSEAIEAVLGAAASPDWRIREHAITALGSVKLDRATSALIAALADQHGLVRSAAARSLARVGDSRAVPALVGALGDGAWYVRAEVAGSLGEIRSHAAIGPLVASLGDQSGEVRERVRRSLAAFGDQAIAPVTAALGSADTLVRWQAVLVLGQIGADQAAPSLAQALRDADGMVRQEAAVALARVKAGPVIDAMVRLLGDSHAAVRTEAAWVLGEIGSARGVEPLAATLADAESGAMAAWALGAIRDARAAAPLATALENARPTTRRAAAWALSTLEAHESVGSLRRALGDTDDEVRYWAAKALRAIGTPEAAGAATAAPPARWDREAQRCAPPRSSATIASGAVTHGGKTYRLYPETVAARPELPSPLVTADGTELVVAVTSDGKYGVFPATLKAASRQCDADADDFPTMARTALHSDVELDRTRTITGRSVSEITDLGRPGRLSVDGFLGADEDVVAVLRADNQVVAKLGLTHTELARPLFHVWNMMDTDLALGRWNMAEHRWRNVTGLISHGRMVKLDAGDTKGAQLSIFADGLEGSFHIEIERDLTPQELSLLAQKYPRLTPLQMKALILALTRLETGEIEPHYIMWYGFYEGRTPWRTDPVAIALIFGLRTLDEIECAFPGRLYEVMAARFAGVPPS